jgi:hypothetical protein
VQAVAGVQVADRPSTASKERRTTQSWYIRGVVDVRLLDRLNALLDSADETTVNTSMRLPGRLRDAAALAVDKLGLAPSTTALTAAALRQTLETAVMRAALDTHYAAHAGSRPSLAEVAQALAAQEASMLAESPDAIVRAAEELLARHPNAGAHDVLLWAEAQHAALQGA